MELLRKASACQSHPFITEQQAIQTTYDTGDMQNRAGRGTQPEEVSKTSKDRNGSVQILRRPDSTEIENGTKTLTKT
jgi:hypothetical protein